MKKINYKGKGEHSVMELEKIIEQQKEELYQFRIGVRNLKSDVSWDVDKQVDELLK